MTRRSLGRHRQTATPAEREELVPLFTGLLERAYVGRVEQLARQRIAIAGESLDGELAGPACGRSRSSNRAAGSTTLELSTSTGWRWR